VAPDQQERGGHQLHQIHPDLVEAVGHIVVDVLGFDEGGDG
jgi:hypothetical protein